MHPLAVNSCLSSLGAGIDPVLILSQQGLELSKKGVLTEGFPRSGGPGLNKKA